MSNYYEDDDPDYVWHVPEYLGHIYALWTHVGTASQMLRQAHAGSELAIEGYTDPDGVEHAPDLVIKGFYDRPLEGENEAKRDRGEDYGTYHDVLVTAHAALATLIKGIGIHLKDMDALPGWWKEEYDMEMDRPASEWEMPDHGQET